MDFVPPFEERLSSCFLLLPAGKSEGSTLYTLNLQVHLSHLQEQIHEGQLWIFLKLVWRCPYSFWAETYRKPLEPTHLDKTTKAVMSHRPSRRYTMMDALSIIFTSPLAQALLKGHTFTHYMHVSLWKLCNSRRSFAVTSWMLELYFQHTKAWNSSKSVPLDLFWFAASGCQVCRLRISVRGKRRETICHHLKYHVILPTQPLGSSDF